MTDAPDNIIKLASLAGRLPEFCEEALALEFQSRYGDGLRYVAKWGEWRRWDGTRWARDDTREVFSWARQVCRDAVERNPDRAPGGIASAKVRAAVVSLASDGLPATVQQWDQDLWLLNTPGGVVDLRSGAMCPAVPEDYITKITAVAPGGACPLWRRFLATITGGDAELERFLQIAVGYSLTGSTREEVLLFLWGGGQNGKSVFVRTIANVLGDYHTTAPIEAFMDTQSERHPTELAGLRGARMVTAPETEQGRRWAESKIKSLTGSDAISARLMRQDFFTFTPQFKLWIHGNYKPGLKAVDKALRRRLRLIPFTVTIPEGERDFELSGKLRQEWPGILAWAIEGCLLWQREGLKAPKKVTEATEDYLEGEDAVARWLEDCCVLDIEAWTSSKDLFVSWKSWAEDSGEHAGSAKRFGQRLEAKGLAPHRKNAARGFMGLRRRGTA